VVVSRGSGGGERSGRGDSPRAQRETGLYLALGATLAGSVLGGVALGYLLDRWLGTSPWLLLIGSILGILSGLTQLYKTVANGKKK
jgi:ATP synthase protein I